MHALDHLSDDDSGSVFRDVIMLALAGFVAIVILLLPHLNPPTDGEASAEPPGSLMVEVRWPDERLTDVDLWVQAPGDVPVGYSSKGGQVFNLLRDDLGASGDPTRLNYEVAYSRGAPGGEYTVNLHLYSDREGSLPVPVTVVVSLKRDKGTGLQRLFAGDVQLARVGEELTVVRFRLDPKGQLVAGSLHQLPRKLRTKDKT